MKGTKTNPVEPKLFQNSVLTRKSKRGFDFKKYDKYLPTTTLQLIIYYICFVKNQYVFPFNFTI